MSDQTPTARDQVSAPWRLLSTLPSTNWKMVSGSALVWVTTLFLCTLLWNVRSRDTVLLSLVDSLLLFVATVAGAIPAAMFVGKRMTFKQGGPDDQRATLDVAAAAQDAGTPTPLPSAPVAPTQSDTLPEPPVVGWAHGDEEGII